MSEHTKEPWHVSGSGTIRYIDASVGSGVVQEVASCMRVEHGDMDANARRIVACVNACKDVPTELLEAYPAPFSEMRAERDKLAALVTEWLCDKCRTIHSSPKIPYSFDLCCKTQGCTGLLRPSSPELRRVEEQRDQLLAALEAAVECGMVPKTSAHEGGASKYSLQVRVADQIREAIALVKGQS